MSSAITAELESVYIRIRIPKIYQRQPIISRLISRYGLTVNIAAALLATPDRDDGWFDLDIQGDAQQIGSGLAYLEELNIKIVKLNLKKRLAKKSDRILSADSISTVKVDETKSDSSLTEGQTNRTKFQVCIPKNYRQHPIIAALVSHYGLTVNITSALLGADNQDDGWFDLELWGSRQQILSGFKYLNQLGLEIWH